VIRVLINRVVMVLVFSFGSATRMCAADMHRIRLISGQDSEMITYTPDQFDLTIIPGRGYQKSRPNQQRVAAFFMLTGLQKSDGEKNDERYIDMRSVEEICYKNSVLLRHKPWSTSSSLQSSLCDTTASMLDGLSTRAELLLSSSPLRYEEVVRVKSHLDLKNYPDLARHYISLIHGFLGMRPVFDFNAVEERMQTALTFPVPKPLVARVEMPQLCGVYLNVAQQPRVSKQLRSEPYPARVVDDVAHARAEQSEQPLIAEVAALHLHEPAQQHIIMPIPSAMQQRAMQQPTELPVRTELKKNVPYRHRVWQHLAMVPAHWDEIKNKYGFSDDWNDERTCTIACYKFGAPFRWGEIPDAFDLLGDTASNHWSSLTKGLTKNRRNELTSFLMHTCYPAIRARDAQPKIKVLDLTGEKSADSDEDSEYVEK
jgi:hypothetical protein